LRRITIRAHRGEVVTLLQANDACQTRRGRHNWLERRQRAKRDEPGDCTNRWIWNGCGENSPMGKRDKRANEKKKKAPAVQKEGDRPNRGSRGDIFRAKEPHRELEKKGE